MLAVVHDSCICDDVFIEEVWESRMQLSLYWHLAEWIFVFLACVSNVYLAISVTSGRIMSMGIGQ